MPTIKIYRDEIDDLPEVCMLTGEPTPDYKKHKFVWNPSWVYLLVFFGLLPLLIVVLVTRKTMTFNVPLVRAKHGHWLYQQLLIIFGILITFASMIGGAVCLDRDNSVEHLAAPLFIFAVIVLFGTLIVAVYLNSKSLRPVKIGDDYIEITNVHRDFIDALGVEDPEPAKDKKKDY